MKKPLILIAEDHAESREFLKDKLEKSHPFQTLTATDGKEALKSLLDHDGFWPFSNHKIACVILDHSMPNMTGLELMAHIHHSSVSKAIKQIPIIVWTTYLADKELWRSPVKKGYITAFLSKPHDEDHLFKLLHRICVKKEASLIKRETQERFF